MVSLGIEYDLSNTVETLSGDIFLYQAYATVNGEKSAELPMAVTFEQREDGSFYGVWSVRAPSGVYLKQVEGTNEDAFFERVMDLTERYLWDGEIGT